MRFSLIVLTLVVFLSGARADESLASIYDFTTFPKTTYLDAAHYRLTFLRAEPDSNHSRMGLFAFRHTLEKPIQIWGFGFQKDGSLQARFERFSKFEGNRWTEVQVGYCGTGAQTFEIMPNRDYLLRVPLWPFAKTGSRGVILLSGAPYSVISDEFDGEAVRKDAEKSGRSK